MAFTLADIAGLIVATVLGAPLLLLPGFAIGHLINPFGFQTTAAPRRLLLALVIGYAALPIGYALVARAGGLSSAIGLAIALSAVAVWRAGGQVARDLTARAYGSLAAGFALLAFFWVDFEWAGRLYTPLHSIDLVKHAAVVTAIADGGMVPPADPFFLRATPVSYYYFYYVPSAMMLALGAPLVDARAAVGGQVFWTGLALAGLLGLVMEKANLSRAGERVPVPLIGLLMAAGSLQIVVVAVLVFAVGFPWPAQIGWYGDEVTSWPLAILWVPHHLAALIASWAGFLALIEARDGGWSRRAAPPLLLAGAAFASACGLSTWVTLGAVATVAIWAAIDVVHRRWAKLAMLLAGGCFALLLAGPHLLDLVSNRDYGQFPIGFKVRQFVFAELISDMLGGGAGDLVRFLFLPVTWFVAGGICFAGSVAYWRKGGGRGVADNETAAVLAYSALATGIIGSLFASVILFNDLGWRIILFLQFAALLWTTAVLAPVWRRAAAAGGTLALARAMPVRAAVLIAIGFAGVAHELAAVRAFQGLGLWTGKVVVDPRVDHEQRLVYGWLARHGAPGLVVQHNPNTARALNFGLYGRQRTALADRNNGQLFGPSADSVKARLDQIAPVFAGPLTAAEVRAVLASLGVDAVVVSANDGVWRAGAGWVFASPVLFATAHVRVISITDLKDMP